MAEGLHPQPLIQLGVEEILDAELEHLPEGAAIALIDVDVAERERESQEAARRQLREYESEPPVIHEPARSPLQDLASDETRRVQCLIQDPKVEEPHLRARMLGQAG